MLNLLSDRRVVSLGVAIATLVLAPALAAAETTTHSFDVPADSAAKTLKVFSEQSGRGLIATTGVVNGVRTNAIRGDFTAREALERMLAGTGLVSTQDPKTGAFSVRRERATESTKTSASQSSGQSLSQSGHSVETQPGATGVITGRVKNGVTGQYLNNARVSVKGTDLVAFTDQFGTYRLVSVPGGPIVIEVFYTDMDPQQKSLNVSGGQTLEQDVDLTSAARYGPNAGVVELNPYVVAAEKETDAQAIATNEQRFAPNIKNVVATDSIGDVLGSNVGEFLKFLPGISGEYSGVEIIGISVRGFGSGLTTFTADGAPMASAFFLGGVAGGGRDFNINNLALNDLSRMEVTKVPTPSSPADSLGGSINMVSKSAFERSHAELRYGLSLVANHENLTFKKTPHSNGDQNTRKIFPGFDFDYTLPVNKNFGIVLAGLDSTKFNEQHYSRPTYNTAGTGTGASFSRPYLQTYALTDSPKTQRRNSLSLKVDWRVTPDSVLSFSTQWTRSKNWIGAMIWTPNTGVIGTPAPVTGVPMSFGADYVIGATGRGSVALVGGGQTYEVRSLANNLNYRFDDGRWRIEASVARSASDIARRNADNGHFGLFNATLIDPVRVTFSDIGPVRPGGIQAFRANNQEVNLYNIENYRITTARDTPVKNESRINSANINLRRRLEVFPFPASFQAGGAHRIQTLNARGEDKSWTFNGPDGNAGTIESSAPYLMQVYAGQDSHFGFRNLPWISPTRAWRAWQENPVLFSQTTPQVVAEETFRITNSEYIQETVSALYLQGEAGLFKNRLNLLAGVRFEKTTDKGEGMLFDPSAVFVRNADGSFARNAQGNRIRKPESGLTGSMEELRLVRKERAYQARRMYDGYYPSLHLTYNVKENFLARAAYARTYGRPNFRDIIPTATINEADLTEEQIDDPAIVRGTVTVRNTSLRPWTADNYDLSLEYYTEQGGLFSGGVFLKEIEDFFGDDVKLATAADLQAVGLDPRYEGWNLATKFNSGDARILGAEFNVRHSLRMLGSWGRHFTVFANATKLRLEGHQQASFKSFIPKTGNWGFSFSRHRVTVLARWNYRGLDKRGPMPVFGPDGFEYIKARTTLDLSFRYQLTRRLSLAASINNVFNVPETVLRYGSETPDYARQWAHGEFGVAMAIGLKGTF